MIGVFVLFASPTTVCIALAIVLSNGIKMKSTVSAITCTVWAISLLEGTAYFFDVKPYFSAAASASAAWYLELSSVEEYKIPTDFASGINSWANSNWVATGVLSDTPVIFPPGLSISATRLAPTGSVTAPKTIGTSLVVLANAWAAGVAIPTNTSAPLFSNCWLMVANLLWSAWPFWNSIVKLSPSV